MEKKRKGNSRQNKPNICWLVNSVCPSERKSVGLLCGLSSATPASFIPTLHEHKTTLCDVLDPAGPYHEPTEEGEVKKKKKSETHIY